MCQGGIQAAAGGPAAGRGAARAGAGAAAAAASGAAALVALLLGFPCLPGALTAPHCTGWLCPVGRMLLKCTGSSLSLVQPCRNATLAERQPDMIRGIRQRLEGSCRMMELSRLGL